MRRQTFHSMAAKHLSRKMVVALCVLFVAFGYTGLGQARGVPNPAYHWGDLHWKERTIYQVGNTPLPVAITLPSWFTPIGDKVLIRDFVPVAGGRARRAAPQFMIYFWLPLEQRARVQSWLNGFPAEFILPAGSFALIEPRVEAHIVRAADPRNWHKVFRPNTKRWQYWVGVEVPADPPFREEISLRASDFLLPSMLYDPNVQDMGPGFTAAVLSQVSPIRKEKRLVLVSCRFSAELSHGP